MSIFRCHNVHQVEIMSIRNSIRNEIYLSLVKMLRELQGIKMRVRLEFNESYVEEFFSEIMSNKHDIFGLYCFIYFF